MKLKLYCKLLISLLFFFSSPLLGKEAQNSVIVCDNGLEMFQWDLEALKQATQSVEISACLFGGDIARTLLSEIGNRLEQVTDLQVYILATPILIEDEDQILIDRLLEQYPHNFHIAYASNVVFMWPNITGVDNHIKLFVVDEKYYSVGGTNLDEKQCTEGTYTPSKKNNKKDPFTQRLPSGMRDQDIVGRGELAHTLRELFFKIYSLWEHYDLTGVLELDPEKFKENSHCTPLTANPYVEKFEKSADKRDLEAGTIKMVLGGPHQSTNAITQEYTRLIEEARDEIVIANLYFCPAEPIFKALLTAVNRGVKLTVLTNGMSEISPEYAQFFAWANRMSYVPVFYGETFRFWDAWTVGSKKTKNTRIFEYHVKDVLLHKKVMVVDHKKMIVGSYNLGTKSDEGDYELGVVIENEQVVRDFKKVFEKDILHSVEISPLEARDWYFDPLKAYLGEVQKLFHGFL